MLAQVWRVVQVRALHCPEYCSAVLSVALAVHPPTTRASHLAASTCLAATKHEHHNQRFAVPEHVPCTRQAETRTTLRARAQSHHQARQHRVSSACRTRFMATSHPPKQNSTRFRRHSYSQPW
jgi:hypothetical protein